MDLDGFGDIFETIRKNPKVIFPAFVGVIVALLFDIILFEYSGMLKSFNFSWIPFSFEVLKWSVAFTLSAWTALLIKERERESHEIFSNVFLDVFVFSIFMAFFVVAGFAFYIVPGFLILFFMIYIPSEMVLGESTKSLGTLKRNLKFILEDAHVIHTLVALLLMVIFVLIPYVGEYLAIFFYILCIPNIYISGKNEYEEGEEIEW